MLLHDQLLHLALSLATGDTPTEAACRRSISTAYYALFHRLVYEVVFMYFPSETDEALRTATARSLEHENMKQVCQAFSGRGRHKKPVEQLLQRASVPKPLAQLSATFVRLQEARHASDYDISFVPSATEAERHGQQVKAAFVDLDASREDPLTRLFLGSLLLAKTWRA